MYGFEGETKKKYSELTYKLFEEVFTARAYSSCSLPPHTRLMVCSVPLSTLVSASNPPRADATPNPKNPTLYEGRKRFFVVHGTSRPPSYRISA